jgi:chemotaxis family two-component system response regulator PixG
MPLQIEQNLEASQVRDTIAKLSSQRATGELSFNKGEQQWTFYFVLGYLRYATGGSDRTRRWYRAIEQHCSNFTQTKLNKLVEDEPWEYQLLCQGITDNQISLEQARAAISSSIQEVLFTVLSLTDLTSNWAIKKQPTIPSRNLLIKSEEILVPVQQLLAQVQQIDLAKLAPNLVPVLKPAFAGKVSPAIAKFFQGKHAIWDIAVEVKRPVTQMLTVLLPLYKQNAVELQTVEDLAPPIASSDSNKSTDFVIACIDDSAVMCQTLEKIMVPAGYRVVKIQKALEEMSALVKSKPDLIFLDLMMPEVNGYTLCNFLKQTAVFENTPIIILTSSEDSFDRSMTEVAGAAGFINKPPKQDVVLDILKQHLSEKSEVASNE